ncbi:glycosyltransferase family 4 protein [Mesorhizobium sp. M0189]|uniref:glycosyltransferase family 4 protein n=1 Tax=Mesorhizobium sp. M0189 TaxID=2956909 RepID=UPI00333C3EC8
MKGQHLIIIVNLAWNIVNFRAGLVRTLIAAGYKVTVVAVADGYENRVVELGCDFIPVKMAEHGTSPLEDIKLMFRYYKIFAVKRPDAILSFTIKPNIFGSLAANWLSIPVINNVPGLGAAFSGKRLIKFVVEGLYRISFRRAFKVIFQNDQDRELFSERRLVEPSKTLVVPGSGIDLSHFQGSGRLTNDSSAEGLTFIFVGRLLREKGVLEFVEAARVVKSLRPASQFQILGFIAEGSNAITELELAAWQDEGIVEYLGSSDDVRPFIQNADCVVLPSFYREGTPRSLLEAAALSRPIITTDWVGCRDVVDDGINGYLCKVKDHAHLAEQLMRFIALGDDQRMAMGAAGRSKVEQQFDEKIVVRRYIDALQECRRDFSTRSRWKHKGRMK